MAQLQVAEKCQALAPADHQHGADEAKQAWARQGADFTGTTGAQFGSFINAEVKKWAEVVKASGAKVD